VWDCRYRLSALASIADIGYPCGMPRPMLYPDIMPARLSAGTLDRMRAVLRDGETVADLLRVAVEAELARRAAEAGTPGEQATDKPRQASARTANI
jgi:hypothetical protein